MTIESKLMIALPIESDVKTFADWLLNYYEKIPFNLTQGDEPVEGFFVDTYFQHLPGGHSGLYLFNLYIELNNLRHSNLMTPVDDKWVLEFEELSQGKAPIGNVRVERVNNNSIKVFFRSVFLGDYLKNIYQKIYNAICDDFFLNIPPDNMIDKNIQPGKPETAPPGSESEIYPQHLSETEVDIRLSDVRLMKQFYKDYSPHTAKIIYEKIPIAWNKCDSDAGRWGPSYVAEICNLREETITRYIRAFYCAGLREFYFDRDWISIPYHPRKPCPKITS